MTAPNDRNRPPSVDGRQPDKNLMFCLRTFASEDIYPKSIRIWLPRTDKSPSQGEMRNISGGKRIQIIITS